MSDEQLVATQEALESQIPTAPIPAGGEELVDTAPNPAALQVEIERLQTVRKEAEEKAVYWRKQKAEARAEFFKSRGDQPPPPPVQPEADLGIGAEPKQDAFDDYQKYLDAKIAYEVNKVKITWDRDQSRKAADQTRQQKMADLHTKLDDGYKKYADFESVALDQTVPITPMIVEILADSDRPADVAYFLGKNKAEAIAISRMTPIQATRALAKIEGEMTRAEGENPPVLPKISNAPPPIRPLGSSHTVEKSLDKMTQREFEVEMERRTKRRF